MKKSTNNKGRPIIDLKKHLSKQQIKKIIKFLNWLDNLINKMAAVVMQAAIIVALIILPMVLVRYAPWQLFVALGILEFIYISYVYITQ